MTSKPQNQFALALVFVLGCALVSRQASAKSTCDKIVYFHKKPTQETCQNQINAAFARMRATPPRCWVCFSDSDANERSPILDEPACYNSIISKRQWEDFENSEFQPLDYAKIVTGFINGPALCPVNDIIIIHQDREDNLMLAQRFSPEIDNVQYSEIYIVSKKCNIPSVPTPDSLKCANDCVLNGNVNECSYPNTICRRLQITPNPAEGMILNFETHKKISYNVDKKYFESPYYTCLINEDRYVDFVVEEKYRFFKFYRALDFEDKLEVANSEEKAKINKDNEEKIKIASTGWVSNFVMKEIPHRHKYLYFLVPIIVGAATIPISAYYQTLDGSCIAVPGNPSYACAGKYDFKNYTIPTLVAGGILLSAAIPLIWKVAHYNYYKNRTQ